MRKLSAILLSLVFALSPSMPALAHDYNNLGTNIVIKGSNDMIYYIGRNNQRYAFPIFIGQNMHQSVFLSWYPDFSNVIHVTDQILAAYPIAGNATIKPGTKLIKIASDPTIYAIDRGAELRTINATMSAAIYGSNWQSFIEVVPDAFFTNYRLGRPITSVNDYDLNAVLSINNMSDNYGL